MRRDSSLIRSLAGCAPAVFVVCWWSFASVAQAGPPMMTDDPGTPGRWQVFGDVGFDWAIKQANLVWAGVAGSVELDGDLTLLVEVHAEAPVDGASLEVAVNVGLTYEFDETFTLLASGGTATWTGGPDVLGYLGLQTHF